MQKIAAAGLQALIGGLLVSPAVLANPLVYASEGLRATLTPQLPHMPAAAFLGVLAGGTALLGWLATRTFTARVLT